MIEVKATREGLVGKVTATGFRIDRNTPFVALPSKKALYSFVHIHCLDTDRRCLAIVLDVGPWNIDDDSYVYQGTRPLAEGGIKVNESGQRIEGDTNGAGIDLSEAVWRALNLPAIGGSCKVEWEFAHPYLNNISGAKN
jgi:hypothetical protein